jgi:hypothetical protein
MTPEETNLGTPKSTSMLRGRQFYKYYATLKWLELPSNKLIATYHYMHSISWTVSMLDTENFQAQSTLL